MMKLSNQMQFNEKISEIVIDLHNDIISITEQLGYKIIEIHDDEGNREIKLEKLTKKEKNVQKRIKRSQRSNGKSPKRQN